MKDVTSYCVPAEVNLTETLFWNDEFRIEGDS